MKTKIAFFTSLLLFRSVAFACGLEGTHDKTFTDFYIIQEAIQSLIWNGASEEQFLNANCKAKAVPDVNAFLQNVVSPAKDKRIKNFRFQDEKTELLDAFSDLVKNYNNGPTSSCTTVLCAVDSIWGPEIGRKLLYMRVRHGYNGSEYAFSNARRFEPEQLDKVLIAMADLPSEYEFVGRNGNQRLTLSPVGDKSSLNPMAAANAEIKIFDPWLNQSNYIQQYTLFHEFAHNIGTLNHRFDESREWRELAKCEVSEYGNTNQREDFAETIMAYRYNAQNLKQNCPGKYEVLKSRIFSGKEFINSQSCE